MEGLYKLADIDEPDQRHVGDADEDEKDVAPQIVQFAGCVAPLHDDVDLENDAHPELKRAESRTVDKGYPGEGVAGDPRYEPSGGGEHQPVEQSDDVWAFRRWHSDGASI